MALGYWLSCAHFRIAMLNQTLGASVNMNSVWIPPPLAGAFATHRANPVSSDNALEDVEPSTNVRAMAAGERAADAVRADERAR